MPNRPETIAASIRAGSLDDDRSALVLNPSSD
jgi:hypothetical protein